MRLRMIGSEPYGSVECAYRLRPIVLTKVSDTQVQKQIPLVKAELGGCEIFVDLVYRTTGHTVGETQVIVCKCIIVVHEQNLAMQPYRGGRILEPKRKIGIYVASLS